MIFIIFRWRSNPEFYPHGSISSISVNERLSELETSAVGLSDEAVLNKRVVYGWNELPEAKRKPVWKVLLKQFRSLLVMVLLLAAVISYFMHHIIDVYVILAVVLINTTIGFVQEIRGSVNLALASSLAIQIAIIELPVFQRIFGFTPMVLVEFITLIALSSLVLWIGEFHKFFLRRVRAYISRIR